jgi:hypothetical protein
MYYYSTWGWKNFLNIPWSPERGQNTKTKFYKLGLLGMAQKDQKVFTSRNSKIDTTCFSEYVRNGINMQYVQTVSRD